MGDQPLKWHKAVQGEVAQEAAAHMIEVVETLLDDPPADVLRQISSELILGLRDMRNLTQRMLQELAPQADSQQPGSDLSNRHAETLTPLEMTATLLGQIADARQLANVLRYYALACAETGANLSDPNP